MILSKAFSHSRTSEFYAQFFKPRFDAFQRTVQQTPLVIMLWGPRQRTRLWSNKRQQIRDNLRRMGHTVFFSEQLGVPLAAITKKGVEFLQSETADLIIVLQSSYDTVGAVQHFAEFRVVGSKMLLFIDAAAPDERLYRRALDDLTVCYNNVASFNFPDDVVQDNLTIKIVEKVNVMQLVKYCANKKEHGWRLGGDGVGVPRTAGGEVQPFRYNLLELYRDHRDEIDVLADSAAMFVLAYTNYTGTITVKALAHQVGLAETLLQSVLVPLLRSQMMIQRDDVLTVTGFGQRTLTSMGLVGMMAPPVQTQTPAFALPRVTFNVRSVGMAFAAVLLFFALMFYWSNTTQTQLPLEYTPTRPAATRTATPTPLPGIAPAPTIGR